MKSLRTSLLTIAAAALLAASLAGQQSTGSNNQQMGNMQGMQMNNGQTQPDQATTKGQMMQSCRRNMQSRMNSNGQITKDIEAAKQSNDLTKMRAALDEAEKALSPMNEHMKSCMGMMSMMQNMNGMKGDQEPSSQQPK